MPLQLLLIILLVSPVLSAQPVHEAAPVKPATEKSIEHPKRTLLILPLEVRGSYQPFSKAELAEALEKQIEKIAPNFEVEIFESYAALLGPADAARYGRDNGADFVLYGDMRFNRESKVTSMTGGAPPDYPGGSGIPAGFSQRYMVTVAGVAHARIVDSKSGEIVAEQPEMVFETEMTGGSKDGPVMQKVEERLAQQCLYDLSKRLVEHLQQEIRGERKRLSD